MFRGPPRSWRNAIRSHAGKPALFGFVEWSSSTGWRHEIDIGLCYITRVIGRHFDVSKPANHYMSILSISSSDIIVEALSEHGIVQVRTHHRATTLLEPDGGVIWPLPAIEKSQKLTPKPVQVDESEL